MMKKLLPYIILLTLASNAEAQRVFVIRAPSTTSLKEYLRLYTLAQEYKFGNDQLVETPSGDVLINLKETGVFVVSRDSELMGPIALQRELFALSKKYDSLSLIPFSELSKNALAAFKTELWSSNPRYDVGPNSAFVLSVQFSKEVRARGFIYASFDAPTKYPGTSVTERREKQAEFDKLMAAKPLVIVRRQDEVDAFAESTAMTKEGVFYDQTSMLRPKLELDRRGIEIFESWSQQVLQRIDDDIATSLANDKEWDYLKAQRNIKSIDELRTSYPDQFEHMGNIIRLNYQSYGLSSPHQADDLLLKANLTFGFRFSLRSSLEGQAKPFIMHTHG